MLSSIRPPLFSHRLLKGWFVFSLAGIFFLYELFCRASFGSMSMVFAQDLDLDALTVSSVSSAYFLAYSLMQLPVGVMIDQYGVKKVGVCSIIITALGTLLFSISTSVLMAWVARFTIGLGSAFAFAIMFKIILDWFPHQYLGVMGGATQILGMVGPILAGAPFVLTLVVTNNNWRLIFQGVFGFGCILALFFFVFVKDKSKGEKANSPLHVNSLERITVKEKIVMLIKIKQVWFISIFAFFVYPAVEVIGSMSGVTYLEHFFSQTASAGAVSFVWLGLGLGSLVVGLISDRLGNRKKVLLACAFLGVVTSIFLNWLSINSYVVFSILMLFLGVAAGAQTLSFALMIENVPPMLAGTAVGFNNMFVLLGVWVSQNITGIVLNFFSTNCAGVYGYQVALTVGCTLFFMLAFIIGSVVIKETNCKRVMASRR